MLANAFLFGNVFMKNPFKILNKLDYALWLGSIAIIVTAFAVVGKRDYITLASAVIGITAVLFTAKGHVLGQALIVVFSVFYGVISYYSKYYGEMMTYLGMSAPVAVAAVISWIRHPHGDGSRVKVASLKKRTIAAVFVFAIAVTAAFYFILRACGTANIEVSTLSVATSFLAAAFTVLRSPLYAVFYALNDFVLIVLWTLATYTDISNLPMIICFSIFSVNDVYGFICWRKMKKVQSVDDWQNAKARIEKQCDNE